MTDPTAAYGEVRMTRRIVVDIFATATEADAIRSAFEQAGGVLNARASYHHRHSAPCCIQPPYSAFGTAARGDEGRWDAGHYDER